MTFKPYLWVKSFFKDEIPNKNFYKHDNRMFYWYEKLALVLLEMTFIALAALAFYQFGYYMIVLASVPNVALFQPVMLFFAGIFMLSAFSLTLNLFRNRNSKTIISLLNIGVLLTHMILTLVIYKDPIYSDDVVSGWVGWTMIAISSFGMIMAFIIVVPHVEVTPAYHTHHNFDKKTNKWYVGKKPADPMDHVAGLDLVKKQNDDKSFDEIENSQDKKTVETILKNKKIVDELREDEVIEEIKQVDENHIKEIVKQEKNKDNKKWFAFSFFKKDKTNINKDKTKKENIKKQKKTSNKTSSQEIQEQKNKKFFGSWEEYYNEKLIEDSIDWKINELKSKKDLSNQQLIDLQLLEKQKAKKVKDNSDKVVSLSEKDNSVINNVFSNEEPTSWHQYYYEKALKDGNEKVANELKQKFPSIVIKNKTHDFKVDEQKVKDIKHVLDVAEQKANKKKVEINDERLSHLKSEIHKTAKNIDEMIDPVWSKEKNDVEEEFYKAVEDFKKRSYLKNTQEAELMTDIKINQKLDDKK